MLAETINDALTVEGNAEGTVLANRYRVVRQLGRGGMGSVWLAEDTQLDGKPFAIKMLPSILVANKRAYRQLKDEALVTMRLVHPNIVQIRAFEENDGNPFLVMDYIDGQTLDDYLSDYNSRVEHVERVEMSGAGRDARPARPFGGLPEADVLRILRPIAAALDYAHTKGVVHRDVKPGNVMIAKDGTPYIFDFGIAREIQETMTRMTGKLSSGTLLYMSPEQLHGASPKPAQDIYSFAAMVYECLKGEPPFVRGQIEYQIDNDLPEPLPGGPRSCAAAIMAGLAKKSEDRPPTCAAVLEGDDSSHKERKERKDTGAGALVAPVHSPNADAQRIKELLTVRVLRADELFQRLMPFRSDPKGLESHLKSAEDSWAVVKASVHMDSADAALVARTALALEALEREFLWLQESVAVREKCRDVQNRIKVLETDLLAKLGEYLRADERYAAAKKQEEMSAGLLEKGDFSAAWALFQKVERAVEAAGDAVRARRKDERDACIKRLDEIMARVGYRAKLDAEYLKDDPDYQKGCSLSEEALRLFNAGDFTGADKLYVTMGERFESALKRLDQAQESKSRPPGAEQPSFESVPSQESASMEIRRPGDLWKFVRVLVMVIVRDKDAIWGILYILCLCLLLFLGLYHAVDAVISNYRREQRLEEPEKKKAHTVELKNVAEGSLASLRKAGAEKYGDESFVAIVAQYNAGMSAFYRDDYGEAKSCFDKVLSAVPECEKVIERRTIEDLKNRASVAQQKVLDAGGNKRFVKVWNEAVVAVKSGNAKYADSDFDGAKTEFEKSLGLFAAIDWLSVPQNPQHGQECALMLPSGEKIVMIYVAPGSFTMGSENGGDNEKPVHKVTLTKGYWLGKYEVTQAQWESVMGNNPSRSKGDDKPVEKISWIDCQKFIQKVNAVLGDDAVRLPTEAEWEYACRAGTTGDFGGTRVLDEMGWYRNNSSQTHPVGQKKANDWGFHDMHGNVWEWCNDLYGEYDGTATDPTGPTSGVFRVSRGGCWNGIARFCRSASRIRILPDGSRINSFIGFRLCCSAGPRE